MLYFLSTKKCFRVTRILKTKNQKISYLTQWIFTTDYFPHQMALDSLMQVMIEILALFQILGG